MAVKPRLATLRSIDGAYQRWVSDDGDHFLICSSDAPDGAKVGDRGLVVYTKMGALGSWYTVRRLRNRSAV